MSIKNELQYYDLCLSRLRVVFKVPINSIEFCRQKLTSSYQYLFRNTIEMTNYYKHRHTHLENDQEPYLD